MGRFISGPPPAASFSSATKVVPAGYMGEFGNGLYRFYSEPGTYEFTVPENISRIRVRVVGSGGGGHGGGAAPVGYASGTGGGGGGYAHGEFEVTPGQTFTITVPPGGIGGTPALGANGQSGGTTSFGSLISATGGEGGVPSSSGVPASGGIGVGGDFQSSGGSAAPASGSGVSGGAGAGSQLGAGGSSLPPMGGRTGAGGILNNGGPNNNFSDGGSAFGSATVSTPGPNIIGSTTGDNPINAIIRFPFDGFTGPGNGGNSGGGRSGTTAPGNGGVGGGGGAATTVAGGSGGIGGGGGASYNAQGGSGGPGLVIVEF